MSARPAWLDALLLQITVVTWGFTAILGRFISLEPAVLVTWRTGLAAAALLAWLTLRRATVAVSRGDAARLVATGGLIGLHWFLFFLGSRKSSVAVSLAGVATLSLWIALLEPLLVRGRRWSWREMALSCGVLCGVAVIQLGDDKLQVGLFVGIASGMVAAVFAIINSRMVRRCPPLVMTFYEMAGACAACAAGAVAFGEERWIPAAGDWAPLLTLSIVCTVFAYSLCVELQRRISAFSVGLAGNLEPIYAMILAPIFLGAGEKQTPRVYAGAAIIIGCVALHGWLAARRAKRNALTVSVH